MKRLIVAKQSYLLAGAMVVALAVWMLTGASNGQQPASAQPPEAPAEPPPPDTPVEIGADGVVLVAYPDVKPGEHAEEVLADLERLGIGAD